MRKKYDPVKKSITSIEIVTFIKYPVIKSKIHSLSENKFFIVIIFHTFYVYIIYVLSVSVSQPLS